MKEKILLVDDEKDIVEFLQYALKQEGFDVITAYDGLDALSQLGNNPDLIVLDVMMPRMDGFEFCRKLRENDSFDNTPIIFLTARSSEADEIAGLNLGAADYIKKPVSTKSLIARVRSNLRKRTAGPEKPAAIESGPLLINKDQYTVHIDGEERIFPRKEFEILFHLANNPGRVFSRETLLKEIWGAGVFVVDRTIDVHIRKIREKLGEYADLIETIKGVGYRFRSAE